MSWRVESRNGGIFLPQADLWLDPPFPVARAFVSHAHADHIAPHREVICSEGTARLMASRMAGERSEIVVPWDMPYALDAETEIRLYPAGHIHGSAQLWAKRAGETFLYTGDFKLRPGLSAEPCATPRADVLLMETTFGLPRYRFPATEQVLAGIVLFCREALDDGETPVLLGYSLGKSQELLAALGAAGLPVLLHPGTAKITRVYEKLGVALPPWKEFAAADLPGHAVLCPPQANASTWLRKIKPRRVAVVTGWAVDPNAVYRYQCDAAFPLSDHADYDDLLAFVEKVGPKRVYTTHGFAREFAATLRARETEAWALGADNQLDLLAAEAEAPSAVFLPAPEEEAAPGTLRALAAVADRIGAVPGKLEKVALLAAHLRRLDDEALAAAVVFLSGRPFPAAGHRPLHLGWALIRRAVLAVSGAGEGEWRAAYARHRDSGETAEALLFGKTRPEPLPLPALAAWFAETAATAAPDAKRERLELLLRRLAAPEAKYLVKIVTGDLRAGLKEGLVAEALAAALDLPPAAIREAHLLTGDLAQAARAARTGTLAALQPAPFRPLPFMLASPEPDAASIVERVGLPAWVEEKYDGIRCQVHQEGSRVELYSRELKPITRQFPELARALARQPRSLIADGELLAWSGSRALPFAELQKRLGRVPGDDFFLGAEIPVSLLLYDLLWRDGRSLLAAPLRARRAALEELPLAPHVAIAPRTWAADAAEIDAAFLRARRRGNEGLIVKAPDSSYAPGRRGQAWLKLKKAYATLDVVVVGVEYGHGKRRDVLSDYTFAIRDEGGGNRLLPVGKAYTGLTDAEIATLTEYFLDHTVEVQGRYRTVQPLLVIEVAFDRIQPSVRHASGYALRFPRIVRLRPDKAVSEIDTLETCRKLAGALAEESLPLGGNP